MSSVRLCATSRELGCVIFKYLVNSEHLNLYSKASIPVTQSPIEPPNESNLPSTRPSGTRPDERPTGPSRPLTFDEVVALLVAFLSLGSVLFWGLTRGGMGVFSESLAGAGTAITSPDDSEGNGGTSLFGFGQATPEDEAAADAAVPAPLAEDAARKDVGFGATGSARRELAARAEARRLGRSNGLGTEAAIGAAGIAATAGGASAEYTPEKVTSEVEPTTAEPETDVTPVPAPLSEAATAEPGESIAFSDVPENYWAKPYIDELSSRNLIAGFDNNTFRPDQPVTRAEIAKIVSSTFVLKADKKSLEFSDVENDYWARESIGEVVKGGFMTGFPNNTFTPNVPVTRTQALTTLATGLGIAAPTNVQAAIDRYSDATAIPKWANEKVAAATSASLVVNYPNVKQLNPNQPTTRAELSAMLYQALVREGVIKEPVESEYIVKP